MAHLQNLREQMVLDRLALLHLEQSQFGAVETQRDEPQAAVGVELQQPWAGELEAAQLRAPGKVQLEQGIAL